MKKANGLDKIRAILPGALYDQQDDGVFMAVQKIACEDVQTPAEIVGVLEKFHVVMEPESRQLVVRRKK